MWIGIASAEGRRIGRRAALGLRLGLALAPRLGLAQTDAARERPKGERPKEGDLLVPVSGPAQEPLKPDDLQLDAQQTFVWPIAE